MMGCQPHSCSRHSPSQPDPCYSLASHCHLQETVSVSQSLASHQPYLVQSSLPPASAHPQGSPNLHQSAPRRTTPPTASAYIPRSSDPNSVSSGIRSFSQADVSLQQQHLAYPEPATSHLGSQAESWPAPTALPQFKLSQPPSHHQRVARPGHTGSSLPSQPFPQNTQTPYQSSDQHQHLRPVHATSHKLLSTQHQPSCLDRTDISQQHFSESSEVELYTSTSVSVYPPVSFSGQASEVGVTVSVDSTALYSDSDKPEDQAGVVQHWQAESVSPHHHQLSPIPCPATMLDKKPTLQVVTTDHSPISPSSSASSPRFIFPDMQASSSSGHLGSDSGSSPFMSPVKREVKLEIDTLPQSTEGPRERRRMWSGDTDVSETLVDSETGSSVLEDSSSSREQSPFSAMAESLSLRSPSDHSPSPLTKNTFQHHTFLVASEEEEQGEEEGGLTTSQPDNEVHHSKFKRRLHERYVLSLKEAPGGNCRIKEESWEKYESSETESPSDSKRPVSKMERSESPQHTDSSMPKSPRRSSSDTDMVLTESTEMGGASSADEGDVFMEPTTRPRTKHKPPSLHQREPLDLSRAPFYSGFRSSSGSSPLMDPEHLSPAPKIFSPVFRSPHRLPYSPHGLISPQSQSPLCSVPEGGRIFNFNMPSPLDGPHSDSDLISPGPMSPRIFTFPPQGTVLNPMSEVNRLAVSPRAPYTPPPSFMRSKPGGSGGGLEPKWGDQQGFYSKRSLSESDMTYLCPVCGQVFPTNDNLAKHMTKHLPSETVRAGDNNKVHYCKVCNRSFSRSDMLTRHMRLHTGLKPYECMDCGQVFSRSDHLNTHRRTHTGEKPYRCPHCPYAACRRDMITRHMRTHAKRSSRRGRYLSVPDEGDPHKASGSMSSTDTLDSQDYSTGVHTCSVSSVDSVDSELIHSSHPSYLGASVDSLLSPGPRSSASSRKPSDDLDEGMEGDMGLEGSHYTHFMQYRKVRNWSTTSLESVDSEEAVLIREVLVDDAFQDPDPRSSGCAGEGDSKEGISVIGQDSCRDIGGLDTKTLQRCFISSQPPGSSAT